MKNVAVILLLVVTICLTSCGKQEKEKHPMDSESVSNMQDEAAMTFNGQTGFKERYELARKAVLEGNISEKSAPLDPAETGFSVLPLDEGIYGIPAFVVLPQERELTEAEMWLLASGVNCIDYDRLMSIVYSYGTNESANREYTWEEYALQNKMLELYLYEGLRPFSPSGHGDAVYVDIPDGDKVLRYWIYPLVSMTEEQMLQVVDVKYGHVPKEVYMPLAEEVQYEELEGIISDVMKQYAIHDELPESYYSFYSTSRPREDSPATNQWVIKLHYETGNDYQIALWADNGELFAWECKSPGTYAPEEPTGYMREREINQYNTEPSEKEIADCVRAYMAKILDGEEDLQIEVELSGTPDARYSNAAVTTAEEKYYVKIAKSDLSIWSVQKGDKRSG